ncbi:hypothetical protein ACFSSA_13580 [Luteolibacter algae]|uniref:Uncharacterized protein n=1 Tax=Luteolibacter algae TaxID=454151 RepID=A0ABW5DAY3_9BACT
MLPQQEEQQSRPSTYSPGHPWFYLLGGRVLTPKEIRESVRESGYNGWRADELDKLEAKAEPQRSQGLRKLRAIVLAELAGDLSRYRQVALELHRYRRRTAGQELPCHAVHTSVSLKHNHLYNDFAHLIAIDDLLAQQPDLFGLLV